MLKQEKKVDRLAAAGSEGMVIVEMTFWGCLEEATLSWAGKGPNLHLADWPRQQGCCHALPPAVQKSHMVKPFERHCDLFEGLKASAQLSVLFLDSPARWDCPQASEIGALKLALGLSWPRFLPCPVPHCFC